MATTINDFSKSFKGGVRANLFTCNVSGPGLADRATEYHCKGTSIPASTIGNIDVPFMGRQLKVPGDRTYADWTVTMFNDESMALHSSFEKWMFDIQNHGTNYQSLSANEVYGRGVVTQYSRKGKGLVTYDIEIYPTEVAAIDLAWDSNDAVEEYAVTFAVNHWFAGPGTVSSGSDSGIKGGISVKADTDGNVSAVASVMGTIA
jgi:hypothetical protein